VLLTHWQSLFSNGLETGLAALEEVGASVSAGLAGEVEWLSFAGRIHNCNEMYLSDASRYTLSLGLATSSSRYDSYPGMPMAVTAAMAIPVVILFLLAQQTLMQGITLTGIRGQDGFRRGWGSSGESRCPA
jgi:hypothetical protein